MTRQLTRIVTAAQTRLQTNIGKRFSRFVPVAIVSFAVSEAVVVSLVWFGHVTGGLAGLAGWFSGALVSYVLSRWAWERKGRPHLLKETLPFWLVSVGAAIVLSSATHFAGLWATEMNLSHSERTLFVATAYFVANCLTFITRFAIFHYLLFADRGSKSEESLVSAAEAAGAPIPPVAADSAPEPLAAGGLGARRGGSPAWAAGPAGAAERSPGRRPDTDASALDASPLPEPRTRR